MLFDQRNSLFMGGVGGDWALVHFQDVFGDKSKGQ